MQKLKRFFTRFVVVLLALQTVLAAQALTLKKAYAADPPTTSSVIINEINWAGSYSGTVGHNSDEWIELLNTTNSPIDLTGWELGGVGVVFTIGTDGTTKSLIIPANGYYLVSHFDLGSSSTILTAQPDWILPSIAIANSCQPITISSPDATLIDTAGCNGSGYFGGLNDTTNHIRKSMERVDTLNLEGTIGVSIGTDASSWITSNDHGSLSDNAHNFASPKLFNNDLSAPTTGIVTTGPAWSTDPTSLAVSWSGFTDLETGVDHYLVGYGINAVPTVADVTALQNVDRVNTYNFTGLTLSEGITYFAYIEVINPVGLASSPGTSSGVTITHPTAPITNLTASDLPNDNGGSVRLSWLASADTDHYLVSYSKLGTNVSITPINVGNLTTFIVTGLENTPAIYQFNVTAVAANAFSSSVISVIGSAVDNLPPAVPTLTNLTANCQTSPCNVELDWLNNDPSATYYQVGYSVGGIETKTMDLSATSVTLSLQTGKAYTFVVYAFDAAGNQSLASNQLMATLITNQKIVASYTNGQQQTTVTSLVPPAPPIKPAAAVSYFVSATVQVAEPVAQPVVSTEVNAPLTTPTDTSSNSDWIRLAVIVLVLLLVALGFYLLSRTLRDDNETKKKPKGPIEEKIITKSAIILSTEKRKRGRPKGSTKKPPAPPKPKRGRGRPKGSLNKKKTP